MSLKLYPHQEKAVQLLEDNEGYCLFHDMGSGKTITTITDMVSRLEDGRNQRVLIVCPLSVMPSWVREIGTHTHYEAVQIRGSILRRKAILKSDAKILVINYDLLYNHLDELLAARFDYLVADESQRLISPNARWTRAALKLSAQATTMRALTGTPIRKFALDLYNQMRFVNPSILPWRSFFAFKKHFAIEVPRGNFTEIIGVRQEEKLHAMCAPFADYVTFDDAIPGMPEWVDMQLVVPMVPEQARVYKELKKELLTQVNGHTITAQNAAVEMMRLNQIAGGTLRDPEGGAHILGSNKMKELEEIVATTTGQGIIWCKFRAEIEWISETLGAPHIHGGVSGKDREQILGEFREGKHSWLVCQLQSLAEGVNELSNADVEVRWSYDWSYATFVQSRARMRRSGRTNPRPCRSIQLITEGSTDEKVIQAVTRKEGVAIGTLEAIRECLL